MSLGRNEFSLCFIIPISEFSIKINNALMRKKMAWWFHCGNGRKNPGLWSHQNTWPTLRTKIGTSLPCAQISSEAKQIKKIDFCQSRVRNSICLMLWDLDKCCFKKKKIPQYLHIYWDFSVLGTRMQRDYGLSEGTVLALCRWPLCVARKQCLQVASTTIVLWRRGSQVYQGGHLLAGY